MYITLYFIVTRLPESLHVVRDQFLALDPTDLTVHLLKKHLLAVETSVVAVDAARGTPDTPFFEGRSPSPLAPSYASAAAVDILGAEDVGAASALSGKRRNSKGKGGKSGGGGSEGGGGGGCAGGGGGRGGGSSGIGGGSGGFGGSNGGSGGGGSGGGSGSGGGDSGGSRVGAVQRGGSGSGQRQQQQCRSETPMPQQLQFGDKAERPRWSKLLRSEVDIFALDYDAILAAMYALSVRAKGGCYLCEPLSPGIEAAALGASESALPSTAPAEGLHTFTLNKGASRCFFRDSTTLTPLPAPVPVQLADPSGGPVLARSSTVFPCPMVPSDSLSCLHLSSLSQNLMSTAALHDAMVTTTTPGRRRPVAAPCSCRLLSHQTLVGTTDLVTPPCHAFVACTLASLFLHAAPHSSSFPPTTAPLQTLHMDSVSSLASNSDLPLHSDRGGEFSSDLLRDFCRGEGILLSFTLPASLQQNGVAERRIGLVMEVARTSMIHAAAPHFLWPFACAEPWGAESEGAESGGAKLGGTEPEGVEPRGVESEGAESGVVDPRGIGYARGPAGASPRLSHRQESLSPHQLREWFAQRTRLLSGAAGAGGSAAGGTGAGGARAVSLGCAGVTAGARGTGGAGASGPGGARTRGNGAAAAGGVGVAGTRDLGAGALVLEALKLEELELETLALEALVLEKMAL
ncbi:unnamed protein product [Closterium sp. NIES-54]